MVDMRVFDPNQLVPGQMAGQQYEFDFLMPFGGQYAVRVQLRPDAALRLIRWHRSELRGVPLAEIPEFDDDEAICDAAHEAARAWVATFPLMSPATDDRFDPISGRPWPQYCHHPEVRRDMTVMPSVHRCTVCGGSVNV